MTHFTTFHSPIGELLLVAANDEALVEIRFPNKCATPLPDWREGGPLLTRVTRQLDEYFAGTRRTFDLPVAPTGTPFQQAVWQELTRIDYGTTISYGELAARIGRPKAVRAVGAANGKNPIPIVIPCHRVIGKDGHLTGFGGGLPTKQHLLALEGRGAQISGAG
jgi:methylated-DNA-[protein]-cysteine S-methyltransferase